MPFRTNSGKFERASSLGHVPLVDSPFIQRASQDFNVMGTDNVFEIDPVLLTSAIDLPTPNARPHWIISFDGSPQEVAARETYPSTRLGYIQVAGVLVNLDKMLGQQQYSLVDPAVIQAAINDSIMPVVMPSSNVRRNDMATVRDSWRAQVYLTLLDYKIEDTPLLDTFLLLVKNSERAGPNNTVVLSKCNASIDCDVKQIAVPRGGIICPGCGERLFPTDALRVYEEVSEYNSNVAALNRFMLLLEQMTMVAYMNYFYTRKPSLLGEVAFVLDGPLAIFGPQAWLHRPIYNYIQAMYQDLTRRDLRLPIIIGIEKTGQFAEHGENIVSRIEPRTLMRLTDDYIYGRILATRDRPDTRYGRDEYYGRKFFYKTAQSNILTISIPPLVDPASQEAEEELGQYPLLSDAMSLLDEIGTNLYKNAAIPLVLAHQYASIPLRTGTKVLQLLTQQMLGQQ